LPGSDTVVHRDAPFAIRWVEDFVPGDIFEYGAYPMEEDDIIAFAKRYDPQEFHTNPTAAKATPYGGLIASGLQTSSVFMRLLIDAFPNVASLGSPGWDELRWPAPVRPGDVLSARTEIVERRFSKTRPDRGIVTGRHEMKSQAGTRVFSVQNYWFVLRREPGA
jgi:acyl dehydratase